ncbi:MAG TPA: hypothetical protein PKC77_05075, partial [Sphingopyxis sp.]|nr:hypothetical protein [Sphingopyxis sp.]
GVGRVAGVVATVAAFIPGGQAIAGIAAGVSMVANTVAAVTAKPPAAKGQIEKRLFGANTPLPYAMGNSYVPGVQLHDVGWGGKVSKVWNPYRFIPVVYSCAGPVQSIDSYLVEYSPVGFSGAAATGYYAGFLYRDSQLGASPEADALVAAPGQGRGTPPGWGSDYKLSGFAAVGWSFKFDKDGKVWAQGLGNFGVTGHWVKTYDARKDSTFPGGSGSHRIGDETTWEWSESPPQHAVAYARGREQNGKLVFGPGLEATGIDLAGAVAWDNVCDANGWTTGGYVWEPGDTWDNLKQICAAGGARPAIGADGILRFHFLAPRVSLRTITGAEIKGDSAEGGRLRPWRERKNIVIPRFRSPAHQWTMVQADAQRVDAFVAADGEDKEEEIPYLLVQSADQAAELAAYEIWQRREPQFGPVALGPEYQDYAPGDTLTLAEDCDLWREEIDVVVSGVSHDPVSGLVTFAFEGENPDKHEAVLGATASGPPAMILPTREELDLAFAANSQPDGLEQLLVRTSNVAGAGGSPLTGADTGGGTAKIVVATHERVMANVTRSVTGDEIGGLANATGYHVYFDDADLAGGAVTFVATTAAADALQSAAHPHRFYVGFITTPAGGGGGTGGSGGYPPGWDNNVVLP